MEKYKDIFIIILLLAIVVMVFMVMRSTKNQTQLISAALIGTGGNSHNYISPKSKKAIKSKKEELDSEFSDEGEGEEQGNDKKIKKPKLKKIHKQILSLFKDGQPRTTGEIKKAIMDQEISKNPVEINNSIWNLEPSGTLQKEKINKTNYWGPGEWFQNEMFLEEYAEKIPGYQPEQEGEGEDENNDENS